MPDSLVHALVCHPAAPDACVRAIGVSARREADGALLLGYRLDGDPGAPQISLREPSRCLELSVRLPAELLPAGDLLVGLTAVVEHADGSHRYWALRHPAGQPDFHHRDGFALALKAPTP